MPERRIATVLMLDVVGSTQVAAQLGDARYRELSSRFNHLVRDALKRHGGKEEDHSGDGFFATFAQPDRAIRCVAALAEAVRALGIEIRCGIHTGQTQDQAGKTHGIAVVIGARVMSLAGAGEILVTSTTKELVTGSDFVFEDLSAHELKGVPGTWQVFGVTSVGGQERARPLPAAEAAERLGAVRPPTERERPRPGLKVLIAGALALLVTIAAVAFAATRGDGNPPPRKKSGTLQPGSVVRVDLETGSETPIFVASRRRVGVVGIYADHGLAVGEGGVWVLRAWSLFHVDPLRDEVRSRIQFPQTFTTNVSEGLGAIWVVTEGGLYRVNPATDDSTLVVRETLAPGGAGGLPSPDVAVGAGFVWVGTSNGRLLRLDPKTGEPRWRSGLGHIDSLAVGHGALWTIDSLEGTLSRLDLGSMQVLEESPAISGGVDALAVGERYVWVLSRGVGSLTQVDADTTSVEQTIPLGEAPTAMAIGLGAVWVGDEDGVVRRVDEGTLQLTEIPFGVAIRGIAIDEETETLWIDVA
jgi:class 3 adenylate cyclase/outer membrane protein assembly factor BamB